MSWDWVNDHESLWLWLGAFSLFSFAVSLWLIPFLVVRMERDYFVSSRESLCGSRSRLVSWCLLAGKNLLGLLLLLAGIVMLFIPGQGLLTIVVGLALLDFPGKRQLQLRMLQLGVVKCSLNWIRKRSGKEALLFP